jgi:tRNA pseudouridine13 synthase
VTAQTGAVEDLGAEPLPAWPRTAPPPLSGALLRSRPEDFQVEERMEIVPSGAGEHLWIKVRKRGFNTDYVARLLARGAGVVRRDVGYAGMKDRHAVTEQWFSLHLAGRPDPDWRGLPEGVEIVEAARHQRKLKTGAHAGNCFTLVLRDCRGEPQALQARLESMARDGVPNYFGEQRFGRNGANLAHARALFAGGQPPRDRHRRGLYLSAARSFLFNEVLAERVRAGSWNEILDGEACLLSGSNSFFVVDQPDDTLRQRLAAHDIHASGPLWGAGDPPPRLAVRALEAAVIARHEDLTRGLEAHGLRHERRALRVIPAALAAEPLGDDCWRLRFCLPAGSYATAVVRELADYRVNETSLETDE